MNREQIKKALECCTSEGCEECPFYDAREFGDTEKCTGELVKYVPSLIRELTEENESLKQAMEHEHASFMETFGEYGEKCERLTTENDRLHASCTELTNKCASLQDDVAKEMLDGSEPFGIMDGIKKRMEQDTCISCGEVIPEGRQVCSICETKMTN